jgi:hypothetical protein
LAQVERSGPIFDKVRCVVADYCSCVAAGLTFF